MKPFAPIALCVLTGLMEAQQSIASPPTQPKTDAAIISSEAEQLAASSDSDSQFRLGIAFATGRGKPLDIKQAAFWFKLAAANGHAGAKQQLHALDATALGTPRPSSSAAEASSISSASPPPVSIEVPILSVRTLPDGKVQGALNTCTIEITDRRTEKPLAVSVTEDAPSAIGSQMRAAVWLAATTVALERGTPLSGYRINVTFDGSIDGPSAGGVIALALLSALDDRKLPDDFAFTGTILPNGTIGQVGGVMQKIEAAAKGGKKRVLVPQFYRVDTDPNTGKQVDFADLCESLGLEYLPVANLSQAYSRIHNEKPAKEVPSPLSLTTRLETLLKKLYGEQMAQGDKIFDAIPEAEKQQLSADPFFSIFLKMRSDAESAMRQGNFPLAESNASGWGAALSARMHNAEFIAKISARDAVGVIQEITNEIKSRTDKVVSNASSYVGGRTWSGKAHASELDDYSRSVPAILAMAGLFGEQVQPLVEERNNLVAADAKKGFLDRFKDGFKGGADPIAQVTEVIYSIKAVQLFILNWAAEMSPYALQRTKLFSDLYDDYSPEVRPAHRSCENIIYTTFVAAEESFTADTLQEVAHQAGADIDTIKTQLALNSVPYLSLLLQRQISAESHQNLNDKGDIYSVALSTQDHGFGLANATRQILAIQCGWNIDAEGKNLYSNTGLVRYLLESCRSEAVSAIGKCEAAGVPCWNSIMLVMMADGKRDDQTEDRMDVLQYYLEAGIQAKILGMLFSDSTQTPGRAR